MDGLRFRMILRMEPGSGLPGWMIAVAPKIEREGQAVDQAVGKGEFARGKYQVIRCDAEYGAPHQFARQEQVLCRCGTPFGLPVEPEL